MGGRVLSVASECVPLVKTGGLADVAGALPGAMAKQGWAFRTLVPGYSRVIEALGGKGRAVWKTPDLAGGPARLLAAKIGGLDLLVLEAAHLYARPGSPYLDDQGRDWPDNPVRFAALSRVAADIATGALKDWRPDVVHCHDWQAGLAPYYLRGSDVPTVMTIHNIAFLGLAPADRMAALGLDPRDFTQEGFEFWGQVSALKAGLVWARRLTTVSPTYARELTTEEFGMGLQGLLAARRGDLSGIINGIDTDSWNPATDPEIRTYRTPRGKARAKAALRAELGLPEVEGPLTVLVSRLSHQKGLDLLYQALPALLDRGGQFALLGSGDVAIETAFAGLAERHPNVAVRIGYDEGLSHRMIAGGDAILVPSRFEPCGLTQLYGLRYGTVPVVAMTGGLADTVIHANLSAVRSGVATGIVFAPVTAHALSEAFFRLLDLYADADTWRMLQRNGMRQNVGWDASAAEYAALYQGVTAAA